MAKKTKGVAQAASTIRVARLDRSGVLMGYEDIADGSVATVTDGIPEWVDGGDCDLKPGRYRWNPQAGRFEPVKSEKVEAETAIIEGFRHLRDVEGMTLPAATESWIAEYDKRKARVGA